MIYKHLRFIFIPLALLPFILSGCATTSPDNPHDDWLLLGSKESERETGKQIYQRLKSKDALYQSDTYTRYVNNIGRRLAIYSDWNQVEYTFSILRSFRVNAFALPGGYVFVTRGLLKEVQDEAELAGILAHEVAHVAARHHAKRKQMQIASLMAAAAMAPAGGAGAVQGGLMAGQMAQLGYSRQHEREADRLGMEYATRAGYDPRGIIRFLRTLKELQDRIQDRQLVFLQTHPGLSERIDQAESMVGNYLERFDDKPTVHYYRYVRARRRWLIPDREKEILSRFENLISSYENQDTEAMSTFMHDDFQAEMGDSKVDAESFLNSIGKQVDGADTIDYDYQLVDLEAADTDAQVTYEYEIAQWDEGSTHPSITDGTQRLIWRREQDNWYLIRLR